MFMPNSVGVPTFSVNKKRRTSDAAPTDHYQIDGYFGSEEMHNIPGERIAALRTEMGLSKAALARKAGMSRSALSEVESGESYAPSSDNLMRLADALGVTEEYIMHGGDRPARACRLTAEELAFIQALRSLPASLRAAARASMAAMGESVQQRVELLDRRNSDTPPTQ